MQNKVSIILLNYNGIAFNKACIDSLLLQSYQNFEILFVDNKSSDGSVHIVKDTFGDYIKIGKIKIIENDANYGFAQGNNIGVLHSDKDSEYICLLNNDTTLPVNRLSELVIGIESDNLLGGVGSLVLDEGSGDQLKNLFSVQQKWTINNYIFETSFKKLSQKELNSGIFYTTGIGGCAFMYKKKLLDRPFADFYFAYSEDTYLSMCILLRGYKLAICSKSIVHHYGSGSFGKGITVFKAFHGIKNAFCNNIILHSNKNFWKLLPTLLLYTTVKISSSSFKNRSKGFIKAVVWCIKNRNKILAERERVKKLSLITDKQLLSQLSSTIFENIYFLKISHLQGRIMHLLNNISRLYFRIMKVGQEK